MARDRLRHIAAETSAVVLVCRKCSKKLDGGFGRDGDERLAKALRRSLRGGKPKSAKSRRVLQLIVEVPCLDICPRDAVMVLRGDHPGDWLAVPRGMPMTELRETLGLAGSGPKEV